MSEQYTPDTGEVETGFILLKSYHGPKILPAEARRRFADWLDQVRREAKVEALREMAKELDPGKVHESGYVKAGRDIIRIIEETADQLEQKGKNDE